MPRGVLVFSIQSQQPTPHDSTKSHIHPPVSRSQAVNRVCGNAMSNLQMSAAKRHFPLVVLKECPKDGRLALLANHARTKGKGALC
jgi:hypothetical protein